MKHNLYKSMLVVALAMVFLKPALAQSGKVAPVTPKAPVSPEYAGKLIDSDIKINLKLADLKLENLDVKLAQLDHALSGLEIRLAPKIALIEKQFERSFENFAQNFEVDIQTNVAQPDPGDNAGYVQASEKSKKITKTYSVKANDKLSINNQYGQVSINVWDKNEIKVDVEIKAFEASESKAEELLNNVNISESRQVDLISFKTNFGKSNISWWSRTKNGREEKRGVQVNYVVYMPANNPLDVSNRYGSTILPNFKGPLNINSSYGSFTSKELNNAANRVKVSYGTANIEGFSSGTLDVSYGNLKLTNADKLSADIRYSNAKIGRLTGGGNFDLSYGGCKIEEMDKSVKNLVVNSSYSGLTIGIDEAASFNFDVTVSYAGFNFDSEKVNITSKTPDERSKGYNPTKNYKGTYGKGSDSRVIIKSNYGGVKFL